MPHQIEHNVHRKRRLTEQRQQHFNLIIRQGEIVWKLIYLKWIKRCLAAEAELDKLRALQGERLIG